MLIDEEDKILNIVVSKAIDKSKTCIGVWLLQ